MLSVVRLLVLAGAAAGAALITLVPGGSSAAPSDDAPPLVAHVDVTAERGGTIVVPIDTTVPARPPDDPSEVIRLTNAHRAAAGLDPVVAHPALQAAALGHSRDQAQMNRMTHRGSDGSDAGTRIERAGYAPRTWGENVAAGYRTAVAVTDGWMASPGHRANILHDWFTLIGVAVAYSDDGVPYWTMVLAA